MHNVHDAHLLPVLHSFFRQMVLNLRNCLTNLLLVWMTKNYLHDVLHLILKLNDCRHCALRYGCRLLPVFPFTYPPHASEYPKYIVRINIFRIFYHTLVYSAIGFSSPCRYSQPCKLYCLIICETAKTFSPEYDEDEIMKKLKVDA